MSTFTVPGLDDDTADEVRTVLQERLTALLDLHMTLKHVHWNVVGPNFIAVHEMIDPQVDSVRLFTDTIAERIATLGGEPLGTPGSVVKLRDWEDYPVNRATTVEHLEELDKVYQGVIADQRKAIEALDGPDPVSQDMLIGQSADLEQFHWFVRAHLEDKGGRVKTSGS